MRLNFKKFFKKNFLKLIILGVIIYVLSLFICQCMEIKSKEDELNNVNNQVSAQKGKNQEIKNQIENDEHLQNNSDPQDPKNSGTIVFENVTE